MAGGRFQRCAVGTHLCRLLRDAQDLLDTLAPFFKAGLDKHESPVGRVAELDGGAAAAALRNSIPDVDRHLRDGALEIVLSHEWYLKGGTFDGVRVIQSWQGKLESAFAWGYAGMRINGTEEWLRDDPSARLRRLQTVARRVVRGRRMIVICSYPLGVGRQILRRR